MENEALRRHARRTRPSEPPAAPTARGNLLPRADALFEVAFQAHADALSSDEALQELRRRRNHSGQ